MTLEKINEYFARASKCSVKNACLRYTRGKGATMYHVSKDIFIRKCTSQKCYLQDESIINQDSKRH